MAETFIDLAAIFEEAFGYRTSAFQPDFDDVSGSKTLGNRRERSSGGAPYYAIDELGREYFMPVTLSYAVDDGSGNSSTRRSVYLPNPVVSISAKKTIVETVMTERRGTVKELINLQDYVVKIKGVIISTTNDFPEEQVKRLRNLFEQKVPVFVQCPLIDMFLLRPDRNGSEQVVITQLLLPGDMGVKNMRRYEMELLSDEPFTLTID